MKIFILTAGLLNGLFLWSNAQLKPVHFSDIRIAGELETRALKNYDRLESPIYTPDSVFPVQHAGVSAGWPGDYEGRIILALTLQAQATHREPKYLRELIDRISTRVNEKGYLGPVMKDSILEQQLSGHGWLLRGLCEYYEWKKDPVVKQHISNIITNLALPTRGYHKIYPIDPGLRMKNVGEASGTTQNAVGNWQLSSDIGCDFIFMDGVIQAYSLFPQPEVKALIDEMINRFLEIDLVAINAQTHATLTALRGLLRYYGITHEPYLLKEAEKRYNLYRTMAMTENYENYNWFERPEWTEPCAIIDAYMVATQLWQFSGNPIFLEDAHLVYYNALAHTQRENGGFGLDNCPGPKDNALSVLTQEATWCCTMRGGEGMSKAIQYNYFSDTQKNNLYFPFFNNSEVTFTLGNKPVLIKQESTYPFKGKVDLTVLNSEVSKKAILHLFAPEWAANPTIHINGQSIPVKRKHGFVTVETVLKKGDKISYSFNMRTKVQHMSNQRHSRPGYYKISYGPLLLGYQGNREVSFDVSPRLTRNGDKSWKIKDKAILLTPVFHLLDPQVKEGSVYNKQILFKIGQ